MAMPFEHPDRFESRVLAELSAIKDDTGEMKARVHNVEIRLERLPHQYVPRQEMLEAKRHAQRAFRWAVGLGVPTLIGVVSLFLRAV